MNTLYVVQDDHYQNHYRHIDFNDGVKIVINTDTLKIEYTRGNDTQEHHQLAKVYL